jgi:predicted dehydrogenase
MKKLNLAIIGQGRSGKLIHGNYYRSDENKFYTVKYVVDADAARRERAKTDYPGCTVLADYRELFACNDIDLVVNSTFSEMHYPITKDLLTHKLNVLVEKPFARKKSECDELIALAKENGVTLAVFQQSNLAPFYLFAKEVVASGKLGEIKEIKLSYNGFSRRWDWQTLQKRCAGNSYNTGPHPICIALGLMDFDPNIRVVFSKLDRVLNFGDSDDFCKILLDAPGKPFADIEIHSNDAYNPYHLKLLGSMGTLHSTIFDYKMTYIVPGENPPQALVETSPQDADGNPIYLSESLIKHEEAGSFSGDYSDIGAAALYEELYYAITEGKPMSVTPEMAAQVINVIETAHNQNPLPVKF